MTRRQRAWTFFREHALRLTVVLTLALTVGAYGTGWWSDRAQDAQRTEDNRIQQEQRTADNRAALIASCERGREFREANNAQDDWVAGILERLQELTPATSRAQQEIAVALANRPPSAPIVTDCTSVVDNPPPPDTPDPTP